MRRFLLVLVLAVAVLSLLAVPAPAAAACTCHTAVPPTNGASAAHAPYVPSVTVCRTCHKGMTVPHNEQSTGAIMWMLGRPVDAGYRLDGEAYDMLNLGHSVQRANTTVYLQQRAQGETTFTGIGCATTKEYGNFGFTVKSPVPYAYYRAIAQGQVIPKRIALPCIEILNPTPTLALRLLGPAGGVLPLGDSLTAKVRAKPAQMAGRTVKFTVQKRVAAKWVTSRSVKCTLSASATCSWTYRPTTRGLFRIHVRRGSSADFAPAGSGWPQCRVK